MEEYIDVILYGFIGLQLLILVLLDFMQLLVLLLSQHDLILEVQDLSALAVGLDDFGEPFIFIY